MLLAGIVQFVRGHFFVVKATSYMMHLYFIFA